MFIIAWGLRLAGLDWWAIFSLSTQGFVLVVLGMLIYAFAVFCGSVGERMPSEHPFTGSIYYRIFYLAVPVVGGVGGGLYTYFLEAAGAVEAVRTLALETVFSAYAVWLFIDPVSGIIESLLPESRRARAARLARAKAAREEKARHGRLWLEGLRAQRRSRIDKIRPALDSSAARLAAMLLESRGSANSGYDEAAAIGLEAWQAGGMDAMKELYAATARTCRERGRGDLAFHLDYWWDGVGEWRQAASAQGVKV